MSNRAEQSAPGQPGALSLNTGTHEDESTLEGVRESQKTNYPLASMALLMTVTVGQRFTCSVSVLPLHGYKS